MSLPENNHLKDYVQAMLQNGSTLPDNPESPTLANPADAGAAALALIDLYFTLEEPDERDEVFKQLLAVPLPVVTDFFVAMMQHDQDPWLQIAAAAELARRELAEGLLRLQQEVQQPSSFALFEYAANLLAEVQGRSSYAMFLHIWQDKQRDVDQQLEAMQNMLRVDPALAIQDFSRFVCEATAQDIWPVDELTIALTAFVRQDPAQGTAAFLELQKNLQRQSWPDVELQYEAEAFVKESLRLLQE